MLSGLRKAASAQGVAADVRHMELLAHYDVVCGATGDSRSGFAVILELTDRRLLIEADVHFSPDDTLTLDFFLPAPGADSGRHKVSLECSIVQCRDTELLHYGARVTAIGESSKRAINALEGRTALSAEEQP